MIREATLDDLDTLVEYGRSFYEESGYADYVGYCPDTMRQTCKSLIEGNGVVVIADGGFAGAILTTMYFSADRMAQELFWWVSPDARGSGIGRAMVTAMERWAKACDARVIAMSCLTTNQGVADMFNKAGYNQAESGFVRQLTWQQ